MRRAAPAQIVHAHRRAAFVHHLAQLAHPVVHGRGAVDLLERLAGDLAAVDAVKARPRQPQPIGPRSAHHVDQADRRQVLLEVRRVDVGAAGQPAAFAAGRPVGEQLLMRPGAGGLGSHLREHLGIP